MEQKTQEQNKNAKKKKNQRFNEDSLVLIVAQKLPLVYLVCKRNDIIKYNVDVCIFALFFFRLLGFVLCYCLLFGVA